MPNTDWIKPVAWGAVGGALAITILGFSADWVTTNGSALAMAEEQADEAVLEALTPFCVARFEALDAAEQEEQFAAMEELSGWERGDIVAEAGWATMPGAEEPSDDLAEACSEEILAAAGVE